jgi:hypothetical protein
MDGGTLRLFWERVSNTKFDIGTYENFKSAMADPNRRKKFYDNATSNGLDIGTFEEFEKKILGDTTPTLKTTTVTFEKTPEDKTPTKQCSDFPFELGCVNPKIGDFNAATFRGDRHNDTYTASVQRYLDSLRWFTKENPNKKLTLDIWNEFMDKSVIKESIKKVLKEYINKKK